MGQPQDHPFRKFAMPGIDRPPVVTAERSTLRFDEEVIGVVVGGRARAYRLDAFRDRSRHVVNDVIGDIPVSVAFCDLDNCVRSYRGRPGQGALELSVGGLSEGQKLVLEVGGVLYYQDTGQPLDPTSGGRELPLEPLDTARVLWGVWRRDHPETDVYEGQR
jgi:hypothetical protein